jgi:hypothetical protein
MSENQNQNDGDNVHKNDLHQKNLGESDQQADVAKSDVV